MTRKKFVFDFEEGDGKNKQLLGGKGSGLADMTAAGLPVPPGFTITTEACRMYYEVGKKWPKGLEEQVKANIVRLEQVSGKTFGQGPVPAAGVGEVRGGRVHAGHDGYHSQPGIK